VQVYGLDSIQSELQSGGYALTVAADCWLPTLGVKCGLRSRVECATLGNRVRAPVAVSMKNVAAIERIESGLQWTIP
jgi:hypothetical protein